MDDNIKVLKKVIDESNKIVFFGGAGVSTESGIPDFRSPDGLYNQKYRYPPEQIVSHTFFTYHTEEFYDFYRDRMIYTDAKPNKAHTALAELEERGKLLGVITQNIDGLHQMAGSKNVMELHGSIHRNYCTRCGEFYGLDTIVNLAGIPRCEKCGGLIKPDVVLYEEGLDQRVLNNSVKALRKAEVLIIGGTSLGVYPAAGLIHEFGGKTLVLINKTATGADSMADIIIRDPIGEVLGLAVV